MGLVSPTQSNSGETIEADDINTPVNQLAAVVNGNIETANLADSAVTTVKIADDAITAAKISTTATYRIVGRTTLASAGDTITVSGLPARKYLKILIFAIATGGTTNLGITFNSDTGNNYSRQSIINGAAPADAVSQALLGIDGGASAENKYTTLEMINVLAQEKIGTSVTTESGGAGAAAAPDVSIQNVKWANTSAQISSITVTNSGTGDYAIGSEVVVLGHD